MALSLTDEEYRALIEMHSREIGDLTDQFTCAGSMPEANTTLDDIHERITRMTSVLQAWRGMRGEAMDWAKERCLFTTTTKLPEGLLAKDGPENEIVPGDLEQQSIMNWGFIDAVHRNQCLLTLHAHIPSVLIDHWADQKKRGVAIGSDSLAFHHGVGQSVRNFLRAVLPDDQLPRVPLDRGGAPGKNWDDFYLGALDALAADRLAAPPPEQQPAPAAPGDDQ